MITAGKIIAIAGIHTGIGKTIASAVMAEALGADYWKPVQAGLEERDVTTVKNLIKNGASRVHEEAVKLRQPLSPHAAAKAEGVEIDYTQFMLPATGKTMLVETAGGVLSPMTGSKTMADFIAHFDMPTVLVSQNYLGSINHTLASIEALQKRGVRLLGIVMNGEANEATEQFITTYSGVPILARVPQFRELNSDAICNYAAGIKENLLRVVGI